MSSESAPKPRLVLCPKCRRLLQEYPDYDVYKCGGCGTTLQAKKRRSRAVNTESSTQETDAAPTNALDPKADDKQHRSGEQLVSHQENGLRKKTSSSSSGECSSNENDRRDQIENDEYNGEQLITSQENILREKAIGSSSGECSLNKNGERDQIENVEGNRELPVISLENGYREKETSSSNGEYSVNENGGRDHTEDGECDGEQPAISLESGLRENASSSSTGEFSLNGNEGRDHIENGGCNGEQRLTSQESGLRTKAASSSSEGCSLDGDSGRDQIDENSACNGKQLIISKKNGLRTKATTSFSVDCSLIGNGESDQIEYGQCNGKNIEQFNLSDEELENKMDIYKSSDMRKHTVSSNGCSDEPTRLENEASAELMADNSVENANRTNLQLEREELSNRNVQLEGAGEQLISTLDEEDANDEKSALLRVKSEVGIARNGVVVDGLNNRKPLLEGAEQELISGSDREEIYNEKSSPVGENSKVEISESYIAGSKELNNENLLLEVTEEKFNVCASDSEDPEHHQSALAGSKSEVDITGNASTAKRSSTEKGSISYAYPGKVEEGTSGNHFPSNNSHHSFDCVRSVDTFDNTDMINHSSEISGAMGELSKFVATRSYHAYEGSVSSNDGVDERFPYLDTFENGCAVANGVSEGGSRKGKGIVDSMMYGELETQNLSYFPKGKFQDSKDSRGNQNEVPEPIRHTHAHWMRTKKDELPPKIPHRQSSSQSGYESGSTSNQTHDELYCSSSYLSPDSYEDPDQEKMRLLRMVYKLQDQLNRTSYANAEASGRLSVENHISAYQSHDLRERRFYHGLDHPRCDGRCSHGINWSQKHNFSRLPYLPEPTSSTLHVDHSCFHCCPHPQDWQCSGELPPRVLYQHEELCRQHPSHNCFSSHHSYPSSPQWLMTSKLLSHGREAKSCEQIPMVPEIKKYFKEKPSLTKRHYRPVAGGAPFVTCHKCLNLLQLPADFLLFKRVCHQLKCGACQEVLKFSLQNRSHIVSYAPNTLGDPSSDLDDQIPVIDSSSNPHSESRANSPNGGHISYSDDYGHSVRKSYSSEGDPVSVTPSHSLQHRHSAHDKTNVFAGSIFEPTSENVKIDPRGPCTSKALVEKDEVAVNSNMSSETEALLQPKSSPLHQLMGYSSPSLVVRGKEHILNGEK